MSETDSNMIGMLAAQAMERVDERQATVRTVMVIVEYDEGDHTGMLSCSSDDRLWVQLAFLTEFELMLERMGEAAARVSEDDS